jgi:hypothetical protein
MAQVTALFWYVLGGVFAVQGIVESFDGSERPFAVAAAWLFGIGTMLLAAGVVAASRNRPSVAGPLGMLVFLSCLAAVCVDLVREQRPAEIVLWLPLIILAVLGTVSLLASLFDDGVPGAARVGRALAGLMLVAPAVAVALAVGAGPEA